jgi:hypothetical protein
VRRNSRDRHSAAANSKTSAKRTADVGSLRVQWESAKRTIFVGQLERKSSQARSSGFITSNRGRCGDEGALFSGEVLDPTKR